ncbi:hypothetical protein ABZT47_38170 [Sphaerisporangium sp. NPDC005289]|uniref:hypothetical protein n=1 Tax=Sphaerisporangium sp. NPDC005289 TaxID=3155247 RepID=UPI0033B816F4
MNADLDRLLASIAPDPGPGVTPGARELLEEIRTATADGAETPRRIRDRAVRLWWRRHGARGPRPRSRWSLALPLAVLAVMLSWIVPDTLGIGARPASATLDIRQTGDFYVVTVKDLYADPKRYQHELASRGLKVTIKLIATDDVRAGSLLFVTATDDNAPKDQGTHVIEESDDIFALGDDTSCDRRSECTIGVKIRVGYKGPGTILLGRRARPGELYQAPPSLVSRGQPLHCVDFINDRVPQVLRLLKEHGVDKVDVTTYHGPRSFVPDSWYVHDGVMSAEGHALILADPAPHPRPMNVKEACRR